MRVPEKIASMLSVEVLVETSRLPLQETDTLIALCVRTSQSSTQKRQHPELVTAFRVLIIIKVSDDIRSLNVALKLSPPQLRITRI